MYTTSHHSSPGGPTPAALPGPPGRRLRALPAELPVGLSVAATGAVLVLFDVGAPLRAPLTFFFLLAAPGAALALALRVLDPLSRAAVALTGSIAVNLLVAQGLLALDGWSARGGVTAIAMLSGAGLVATVLSTRPRRAASAPAVPPAPEPPHAG
ncbi:hypothetical protein [Streptomyces sp. GSL17-111]|uniref:hypothetical protein n=1 Tax=Streptomyces sp. GSL17-111 TaxID=3121596 RepID=UPI0030F41548